MSNVLARKNSHQSRAVLRPTCVVCGEPLPKGPPVLDAVPTCMAGGGSVEHAIVETCERYVELLSTPGAMTTPIAERLSTLVALRVRRRVEYARFIMFLKAIPERYGRQRDQDILRRLFDAVGMGRCHEPWTIEDIAAHHGVPSRLVEDLRDRAILAMRGAPEHAWRDRAPLTRTRALQARKGPQSSPWGADRRAA